MKKLSESNIKELLSTILNHDDEIALQDLTERVSATFDLDDDDMSTSTTRPNEAVYEQRVRNLISHKNLPDDVEYKDGVFRKK